MEQQLKSKLKSIVIEIRHLLEGYYDRAGNWIPGDLELKLITLGIRRNESPIDISSLDETEAKAREIAIAFIQNIVDAGGNQNDAITEFIRETAYTWANRLIALRCMEARSIIDEVILQKHNYGGRSLQHHRLIQRNPDLASSLDDGLYSVLFAEFTERAKELPSLFDSNSIKIALLPNVSAIQKCIELLSAPDEIFSAPDALGWAYQYWNTEEKDRVFERVKTVKNAKIEKLDIIPATQLYTEPYMVKFLVQNSLGATWYQMHPNTKLIDKWEYFVKDADRAPIKKKSIKEISFLDPCVGSGHFHLEAFDLFYDMYVEEGFDNPSEICRSIFENNLYGIDIDERAIQISAASLFMKAKEMAPDFVPKTINLVATNIHLSREKDHIEEYLDKYPEDKPLRNALVTIFDGLKHADELGSLLQIEEPVEKELKLLKSKEDTDSSYIDLKTKDSLFPVASSIGHLPYDVDSYDDWKKKVLVRLKNHFENETKGRSVSNKLFGEAVGKGLSLFDFLSRKYDIVATNPPYMNKRNMNKTLKIFLKQFYEKTFIDLYAAFIERSMSLSINDGIAAIVSQQSFMFTMRYEEFRKLILYKKGIEIIAHLGTGAFSEIGGAKVNTSLLLFRNKKHDSIKSTFIRLVNEGDKSGMLLGSINDRNLEISNNLFFEIYQNDFLIIPSHPFCYWLPNSLLRFFKSNSNIDKDFELKHCLVTGDVERFIRFIWEKPNNIKPNSTITNYMKEAKFCKYFGNQSNFVYFNESKIRTYEASRICNSDYHYKEGVTFSLNSGKGFSARYLPSDFLWDVSSPAIFSDYSIFQTIAFLNTSIVKFFLSLINPTLAFNVGDVGKVPSIDINQANLDFYGKECIAIKKEMNSFDINENNFNINIFKNQTIQHYSTSSQILNFFELSLYYTYNQHAIEIEVNSIYQFTESEIEKIYEFIGVPIFNYPYFDLKVEELLKLRKYKISNLHNLKRISPNQSEFDSIKNNLKILFEAGTGNRVVLDNENIGENDSTKEDNDELAVVGTKIPIPVETFLEELSQKLEINPISIYWLLKEGIEKEGWRSIPEERKYTLDRFTVYILRLLGHRWPLQIEANEPLPDWADTDGIIPISQDTGEVTLYSRLRERIAEDFGESNISKEENYFNEVIGTTLERWHRKDFFKHHTSQFKKRPIAWHITSNSRPRRNTEAAFEAVLYYQKIDGDFFSKVRTQYLALVLRKFKTELNSLERYESKTGEQSARIIFLEELIQELETFDRTIQTLILSGFDTPALKKIAVDDAEQVLAIEWRKKIAELFNNSKNDVSQFVEETFTELKYTYLQQFEYKLIESQKKFNEDLTAQVEELYSNMSKELTLSRPRKNGEVIDFESENDLRKWFSDRRGKFVIEAKKWFNENLSAFLTNWIKQDLKTYTKKAGKDAVQSLHSAINKSFEIMKEMITNIEFNGIDELESWGMNLDIYDDFCRIKPNKAKPTTFAEFIHQEMSYLPDINDGVRVNIAPLQKLGILQDIVLQPKDISKAIADRAEWRSDERRWCRDEKLPIPGWWD